MTDTHPCAPCIVNTGTLVNKRDIYRLLSDLARVRYFDIVDGSVRKQGEGCVVDVFQDPTAATLVVNRSLYLNVNSFDYACLRDPASEEEMANLGKEQPGVVIDLVQEGRILRLVPLGEPRSDPEELLGNNQALRAAVDVLAAVWGIEEGSSDSLDC